MFGVLHRYRIKKVAGKLCLLDVREEISSKYKLKVVAIGHSMGARMLSRAIFSNGHIKTGLEKKFNRYRPLYWPSRCV